MKKQRRHRTDTTKGMIAAMQAVLAGALEPPPHIQLEKKDLPFWNSIIALRARQLWNNSDLEIAAQLARIKCEIEELQRKLRKEGHIVKQGKYKIKNPLHAIIETLSRREMSMTRMLHLHAQSVTGRFRDTKNILETEKQASSAVSNFTGKEDFIARPTVVDISGKKKSKK